MDDPLSDPTMTRDRMLDPRAVRLWRLTTAGNGAILLAAAIAAEILVGVPMPAGGLAGTVAVVLIAVVVVVPPLRYEAWRFDLRQEHLYLRHGVLFRTTSIVPYARIQHVDTRHGPLDRWLGLSSLVVYTAGTRGAVITIPALEAGEAESLRDHLAAVSGAGDAV